MKTLARLWIVCVALVPFSQAFGRNILLRVIQPNIAVITNGDVTPAGAEIPRPSREHPVYYQPVAAGFLDFGPAVGGEKAPPQRAMIMSIVQTLEGQGYLVASPQHPAKMMIFFGWGTLNASLPVGPNQYNITTVPTQPYILGFLGGHKLGLNVSGRTELPGEMQVGLTALDINGAEFADRFGSVNHAVIKLSAYSLDTAKNTRPQLLWTTRIAAPSRLYYFRELAGPMLTIAANEIGRQTDRPIVVEADERFHPSVQIGEPTVVRD